MEITYKFLHNSILDELYECWKRSFADYAVDMSYFTKERMYYRTLMDRVDYEYSVGAYDGDTMIGFLVLGIEKSQQLIGFIAYYPLIHWIFQIAVGKEYKNQRIEKYLLSAMLELMLDKTELIKINNIPEAHQMNNILMEFGFEEYIKQFEMEKTL